jgi:diguanylate cyclase (GGDEF)-like protein
MTPPDAPKVAGSVPGDGGVAGDAFGASVLELADLAFETDARGVFVRIAPDAPLGWTAAALLGRPAEALLAETLPANPFLPQAPIQARDIVLRTADGAVRRVVLTAAPIRDAAGQLSGARGVALCAPGGAASPAAADAHAGRPAGKMEAQLNVRLGAAPAASPLADIWRRVADQSTVPAMTRAVLDALRGAIGAEGAATLRVGGGASADPAHAGAAHAAGAQVDAVLPNAAALLRALDPTDHAGLPVRGAAGGRHLLGMRLRSQLDPGLGVAVWRAGAPWSAAERALLDEVGLILRVLAEQEAMQRVLLRRGRGDPLTGLLSRDAFLEEIPRHFDRLDREALPGTLLLAVVDGFAALCARHGPGAGDEVLLSIGTLLRAAVRPTDVVARFGEDRFAVWLNGADHLTAAERADAMRRQAPVLLHDAVGQELEPGEASLSQAIATRQAGSLESVESLLGRVEATLAQVRAEKPGHWRVAPSPAAQGAV